MKKITIAEVEYIAYKLAKEMLEFNESIPDFSTRFPHILESCLAVPFQKFDKKYLYKGLIGKSAILFYLLIKNHPFQNGNKRIALTILLHFLYRNNKWLKVDFRKLYNFEVWIAQSPPIIKTEVIAAIEKFIKLHLVKL